MDEKHHEADADDIEENVCDRRMATGNEGLVKFVGDGDPNSNQPRDEQTASQIDLVYPVNPDRPIRWVIWFRYVFGNHVSSVFEMDAFKG